ncbi:MAG: hypothetical protein ACO289_10345 [Prochlorococcaceae cyanobacterium]
MADAPYLIAMALVEQNGARSLPLQGKSLRSPIEAAADPGEIGRQQALELLLRIWQRSDTGALKRAAGEISLLLAEVPIEALQTDLPQIKADWLNSGDSAALLAQLRQLAGSIWTLKLEPRMPLVFERLP